MASEEKMPKLSTSADNTQQQQVQAAPASNRKKRSAKNNRPQIGGTAVPGAKSTQSRQEPASNDPNEQQLASYSRTMRRRMEQMGMAQSTDDRLHHVQEQRRKRVERRKERLNARRREALKSVPRVDRRLGRRNLYFIIGVMLLIVILIVVFTLLRANHLIGV